jgi:hypothetical protein
MRVITVTMILIATLITGVPIARGQSTAPDGERIRQLREEIQKREGAQTPDDLVELNQSKLTERRAELRTLLKSEMQKLQKHQADLGSFISAEEKQKIADLIQTYTAEVSRLGAAMQKDLAADATSTNSGPSSEAAPASILSATSGGNGSHGRSAASASASTSSAPSASINFVPAVTPKFAEGTEAVNCDEINTAGKKFSEVDRIVCGLVKLVRGRSDKAIEMGEDDRFEIVKLLTAKKMTPKYLVEASEVRLDKQLGASSVTGVSPSLVTHGGVPFILGLAVENGGLTQTGNDTAITFRGNPVGLINAFKTKGFMEMVKESESDPLTRFLKKTSFAFTFNTDRGRDPGVFTGSSHQLSAVSARIELINKRVPQLYIKDWENFIGNEAKRLARVINDNADKLVDPNTLEWKDRALRNWLAQTQADLTAASDAEVSGVLQTALNNLPVDDLEPNTISALTDIENALDAYQTGRERIVDKINNGTVVTFEYLNKRDVNLPDTSNFMIIAEKGTAGGRVNFTFNGSLTIFNNMTSLRNFVAANPTLPAPRRVRDFQFAGGMDIPFGSMQDFGKFVFFANGKYERLLENAIDELGQVLPNTTGDIAHLQLGLKIPVAKTGFKIPVSVTFANRTELITERTVRGNFGFSLDLDTIFSRVNPF